MRMYGIHTAHGVREALADNRMLHPVTDHKFEQLKQIPVLFKHTPVQPGDLIVLTISVIVSILCVSELIARQKHGRAPAAQKNDTGISYHAVSKSQHLGIICLSFCAAVPAAVVVRSVRVVPAIYFIVLIVVRIQIIERKTVMTGQEINARIVPGIIPFIVMLKTAVHISGTADAPGGIPGIPVVPFKYPRRQSR